MFHLATELEAIAFCEILDVHAYRYTRTGRMVSVHSNQ